LKTAGAPVDQFSFLEGADGTLNVLLRANGRGEAMWGAETSPGDLALMRVALSRFSDGRDSVPADAYRALPKVNGYAMQNRYVGNYLLYGAAGGSRRPNSATQGQVYAVNYGGDAMAYEVPLVHGVERIEALGGNAVVVGSDGKDLHFTSLRLARLPVASDLYTRRDAAQGETRSHGFFYKADDAYAGTVGLPIVSGNRSASVLYLKNQSLQLSELGTLDARAGSVNDRCRASCVDWYGNARPLFLRGRVFALMGYEIVEGRASTNGIGELRRISFAPQTLDLIAP
jgi:predicted aconitase with swiveling domain